MRIIQLLALMVLMPFVAPGNTLPGKRPVVIGASFSDGFYLPELGIPFFSPQSKALGLHHHLDVPDAGEPLNLGSNWMFMAPEIKGAFQVKKARESKPTAVFAIDFLFWYLYGSDRTRGKGEERPLTRLEFFEVGLAQLSKFDCPVVVGNIPDAEESVGIILRPNQYPGKEVVEAANKRLKEWVEARKNVVMIDLASFHRKAVKNEAVEAGGLAVPAGESREMFLQWDLLHPSKKGVGALAAEAMGTLKELKN